MPARSAFTFHDRRPMVLMIGMSRDLFRSAEFELAEALELQNREPDQERTEHPRHGGADPELKITEGGIKDFEPDDFSGAAVFDVGPAAGHGENKAAGAADRADHRADKIDPDQRADG